MNVSLFFGWKIRLEKSFTRNTSLFVMYKGGYKEGVKSIMYLWCIISHKFCVRSWWNWNSIYNVNLIQTRPWLYIHYKQYCKMNTYFIAVFTSKVYFFPGIEYSFKKWKPYLNIKSLSNIYIYIYIYAVIVYIKVCCYWFSRFDPVYNTRLCIDC